MDLSFEIFSVIQWILVSNCFLRPRARCGEGCGNVAEKAWLLCLCPALRILVLRSEEWGYTSSWAPEIPAMSLLITGRLHCLHLCLSFKLARGFYAHPFHLRAETWRGSKGRESRLLVLKKLDLELLHDFRGKRRTTVVLNIFDL